MAAHLRVYTVNKGKMDEWLKHFKSVLVSMMQKHGMSVHSAWVNADRTEFIWIREYRGGDIEGCEKPFYASPEWSETVDYTRSMLAKVEIRVIEPA